MTDIKNSIPIINHISSQEITGLSAIYLFGSILTNSFHAKSDIDIAVLAESELDNLHRWNIQERIASQLSIDIDLVDLRDITTFIQKQVIQSGRSIYCTDVDIVDAYESKCIWLYIDLMELNEPIYKQIRSNKTVCHG